MGDEAVAFHPIGAAITALYEEIRMTMRRRSGSILTTFLLIGFVGCGGDDDGVSPEIADLIGTWNATSLTFAEIGGGATVDLIADGGSLTIVFRNNLTYSLTQVIVGPPSANYSEDGTFTVNESVLTVLDDADPLDPTAIQIVTLTSTALTLFLANDEYDFNGDDNDTPASFTLVLVKQ